MVSLSRCVGALSLLLCTSSIANAVLHAEPNGDSGNEVQSGAALRFNKLAAKGDWYDASYKKVHVSIEKGDVNGSNVCSGRFVSMYIVLERGSYNDSDGNKSSDSSVYVSYRKGMWRNCEADEISTSTYGIYSGSESCCSDTVTLRGDATVPEVGTFKLGLKQQLITAIASIKIPMDESWFSSSDDNGGTMAATAVVALKMDCVNIINRHITQAGDFCSRGECFHATGEEDAYRCTTKMDDAVLTGTIEVQGDAKLKLDLAALPAGYTVSARAQYEADNGKVVS